MTAGFNAWPDDITTSRECRVDGSGMSGQINKRFQFEQDEE
jgi:hypothetical protein